jgi:hypothetical protein
MESCEILWRLIWDWQFHNSIANTQVERAALLAVFLAIKISGIPAFERNVGVGGIFIVTRYVCFSMWAACSNLIFYG